MREAMDRGRHHRPGRRALRADQDAAADDRHDPRREEPRARRSAPRTPSSRWTSPTATTALGIAVALGEIEMPTDADVMHDRVAVLVGRVVLVRRRARPGAGRRRRQRPRHRRPLPDRALGDARTRSTPTASGTRSATPASTCPSGRTRPTWTGGWSTSSSSARPARTAWCAGAATPCSTTPTCTGTARSRPRVGGVDGGGDRRPGRVRLGVGGAPGPRRRRPGRRDRRPRLRAPAQRLDGDIYPTSWRPMDISVGAV